MDYKNTPEGRAVQSKYGKILHASRPEPPHNHPRMPMSNRANPYDISISNSLKIIFWQSRDR